MKYIDLLIVLHAIIWLYVIFGSFIDNNHAKFIVYMIIPFIYLLHMLPVHFLNKLKKDELKIESTIDLNKKLNEMYKTLNIPIIREIMILFVYLKDEVFKNSVFNPLSGQGMLLLGMFMGIYNLKNFEINDIIKSINFSKLV